MNDLISRQAAIRFIRDKVSLSLFMKRSVDKADKACMELCDMLDKDLPSAQPEIIRCKDCKYATYDKSIDSYNCRNWGIDADEYTEANDFCSYGKKRDD